MQAKKIGLIGAAAVFASLSLFGGLSVNAEADVPPWSDAPENGLAETSSSVPTNLWCTWYVNGMDANVNLYPIDGLLKTDVIAEKVLTEYDGEALLLTGYALESEALVAGYTGDAPVVSDRKTDDVLKSPDPYDCSWYNAEQGFSSNVSIGSGNQTFEATVNGAADDGMDFGLTSAALDGITITYSQEPETNCDEAFLLEDGATIGDGVTSAEVLSVLYSATLGTTLTCQWDTKFQITMPAGKTPAFPGAEYSFTGPTLKTTVTLNQTVPADPAE